jgi:capsular polysaccharide biosynthesis protein
MISHPRKISEYFRRKIKDFLIVCGRYLPANPIFIGSVKGFYSSSKEYYDVCKTNQLDNVTYTPHFSSSIAKLALPKSIYNKVHWRLELYLSTASHPGNNPETFVISIPNGKVFGAGTIVTPDNKLLLDVSLQFNVGNDVSRIESHLACNYFQFATWQPLIETVAVLATSGCEGYYHWLMDGLPRLAILRQSLPDSSQEADKYLVNSGNPIIVESLKLLGIPEEQLIFSNSYKHFQSKHLVVPSLPGSSGNPSAWICEFLRESFLHCQASITPISKLYVSRSKARYRKFTNEENVLNYLSELGFTPVWLEEHNFATQIAMFANAEIVVAPHGAGLTNLMWCSSGTKVLEIFSPSYVNSCFLAIANLVELDYYYLIGDGAPLPDGVDPHLVEENITVRMPELIETLELMLQNSA